MTSINPKINKPNKFSLLQRDGYRGLDIIVAKGRNYSSY